MYTQTNGESPDLHRLAALGQLVQNILSETGHETVIDDLWSIYGGFMYFEKFAGHNPRCSEMFMTFKDLVFLFQKAGQMKA